VPRQDETAPSGKIRKAPFVLIVDLLASYSNPNAQLIEVMARLESLAAGQIDQEGGETG
jgi:hypothetical protein